MSFEKYLEESQKFAEIMRESARLYEEDANKFWDSLSDEDRLKAFFIVTKKIHQAELVEKTSYRGVIYDTFGFDFDAYVVGMESGYLEIHNALCGSNEDNTL